ncbi:SAM-dependent methyltransferase [Streptomyces sp. CB02923]|uniref:class I SAM-dependent methyltransferase n=1 Tax=Streptomyces sp. CB02923 TaxID=1718985 RepID=UPI0009393B01|nr:class I SAM-dependent methyltransferase [Streptomyces sp. CB02923]OKI07176.1 SAM-dependent methyltransferase [Streptomyces sp. CB02923]
MPTCRICGTPLRTFLDLGHHPLSSAFPAPDEARDEARDGACGGAGDGACDAFRYRLAVGHCGRCALVQLTDDVPHERRPYPGYPYHSSGSATMRAHFRATGRRLLRTELCGKDDAFAVEIGCTDGVVLRTVGEAGIRHLAFEPSGYGGVRVHRAFLTADSAREVVAAEGRAQVVYAANTVCDIADLPELFAGLDGLLAADGVFVFEDPYFGEIIGRTAFDQFYDEHRYYFTAASVRALAERFGFRLVGVERLPVHGGQLRYTLARAGRRTPAPAVAELLAEEEARGLTAPAALAAFADRVDRVRTDLVTLLEGLRAAGRTVAGYAATAKSCTVTTYCGLGPHLVPYVCDSTPAKQGRLTPGARIPVRPPAAFAAPYPDYALLFAWNHAAEIMSREQAFRAAGGRWILYVPEVHVV